MVQKFWFLIVLILSQVLIPWGLEVSAKAAASVDELSVPCRQKEGDPPFLRGCQEVIQGKEGGETATDRIPGMLTQLDLQLKTDIELGYGFLKCNEKDDRFECKAKNGPGFYDYSANVESPAIYHFEKRTCSLFPNFFNGYQPEKMQNHHGQSCGEPACIFVDVDPEYFMGICVGVKIKRHIFLGSRADENYCQAKDKGDLERAYYAGALVQAYDFYRIEVENEISDQKKLNISKSCSAAAQDVKKAKEETVRISQSLRKNVRDRANIADIWNCEKSFYGSSVKVSAGMDVGSLRQSAQHLCAARAMLETSFIQLARCEVVTRASLAFRSKDRFGSLDEFAFKLRKGEEVNVSGQECIGVCNPENDSEKECEVKMNRCASEHLDARLVAPIQSPTQICNDAVEKVCRSCSGATRCSTENANKCYQRELPRFVKELSGLWKTKSE